ncbi:MAG: thiol-disulfide oxidoreductase DCC family protein [Chitinophagales bacterium]|nr:thiol-disulfide oxidoreductase DCC family protein [Chitinophagales bacterium]OJV24368.1 MAG: thiol-disulfide oxidoreductase [Bacteroidetes bacterium 37-13]HRN95150.1 thiol-disulfide oxidoreductase DCC family protein [Chitinophagales bacterium]HRP40315.1 thiol-disulfide oxidoreductase DCC family protein [Chitinophagales bacterium]
MKQEKALILFDGVCNLCESSVQFILLRDEQAYFQFASLQSDSANKILTQHGLKTSNFDSIVLIENGKIYQRSDAALRIAKQLSGAWKLFYAFIIVPRFIRDAVYNIVAKNRYRWFGKKNECMLPKPEWKHRFLI